MGRTTSIAAIHTILLCHFQWSRVGESVVHGKFSTWMNVIKKIVSYQVEFHLFALIQNFKHRQCIFHDIGEVRCAHLRSSTFHSRQSGNWNNKCAFKKVIILHPTCTAHVSFRCSYDIDTTVCSWIVNSSCRDWSSISLITFPSRLIVPTTASRAVGRLLRNTNRSRESYPYHQLLGTSVKKATICSEIPEMLPTKKLSKILKTD